MQKQLNDHCILDLWIIIQLPNLQTGGISLNVINFNVSLMNKLTKVTLTYFSPLFPILLDLFH